METSSIESMPSWRNKLSSLAIGLIAVLSVCYPLAVYLGQGRVAPQVFVALALILLGLRLATLPTIAVQRWRLPLLLAGAALLLLMLLNVGFAAKAYPMLLSLIGAGLFGFSLLRPPSLVEQLASLRRPELPDKARAYCRRVTQVWTIWLSLNAVVTVALAIWGGIEIWALWTGVFFYLASGILMGGEYLVRRRVMRREVGGT